MRKILVDTNVFIDWRRKGVGVLGEILKLKNKTDLMVPTVVVMEYWIGKEINQKRYREKAEKMFKSFKKIELTEKIAKKAGEILRKKQASQAMDAIVGATAIVSKAELATRNKKHFKKIKGLKLF